MGIKYRIITIDALTFYNIKLNKSFDLDLSNTETPDYQAVKSVESLNENPLFYQILKVLGCNKPSEDSLKEQIIIVDLHDLFKAQGFNVDNIKKDLSRNKQFDQNAVLLSYLFSEGLNIKFDIDSAFERWIPFEKSQSMAKACKITFIRESLFNKIDKRLSLDINFQEISLIQSKYWAYRGLYLTDSERVKVELNSKTVIVLDDDFETPYAYKDEAGNKVYYPIFSTSNEATDKEHEFSVSNDKVKINCFDGEGIIDFEYASLINEQIKSNATSWQIRMPFTKGVLHSLKFKQFIKEYTGEENPKINDCFGIERDLNSAGIILTVSMFKCKKWLGTYWEKHPELHNQYEDQMDFFFKKVNQYDHSLYIVKDNTEIEPNEVDSLNYQFLDTLALSKDEFDALIEDHFKYGKTEIKKQYTEKNPQTDIPAYIRAMSHIPNYQEVCVKEILGFKDPSKFLSKFPGPDYSDPEKVPQYDRVFFKSEQYRNIVETNLGLSQDEIKTKYGMIDGYDGRPSYVKAALINPAFYSEPIIKKAIKEDLKNLRVDLGMGRIHTAGELRFLSGDLLSFMIYIIKQSLDQNHISPNNVAKTNKSITELKRQTIKPYCFYMPEADTGITVNPHYWYAVLRNPHQARHEEVILKPFYQNVVHLKYFSHLTGIIMVSRYSLTQLAISGADMDGDMVKVFLDKRIAKAIMRGGYKDKGYTRVLPIVEIPDYGQKAPISYPGNHISANLLLDTFSTNVGELSNLAVKCSQIEYTENNIQNVRDSKGKDEYCYCPKFTIFTGIDIDSCKTSVKCSADIKKHRNIAKDFPKGTTEFLNFKNEIETLYASGSSCKIEEKETKDGYYISVNKGKPVEVTKPNVGALNILSLPLVFAEKTLEAKEKNSDSVALLEILPAASNNIHFSFEKDEAWIEELEKDSEKIKRVKALYNAYKLVRMDARNYSFTMNKLAETNLYKKIMDLLFAKYDDYDSLLPGTNADVSVIDALCNSIQLVQSQLNTKEKLIKALKTIREDNWQFIQKESRQSFIISLLNIDNSELLNIDSSIFTLLCDFKNQGYRLLYYIVKHCYYLVVKAETPADRKDSATTYNDEFNYYGGLFTLLDNGVKEKLLQSEISDSINIRAYNLLMGIANGNKCIALKLAWYLRLTEDLQGRFIWSILPENMILENVEGYNA